MIHVRNTMDPLGGLDVLHFGGDARQEGISEAYRRHSTLKWHVLCAIALSMLPASVHLSVILGEYRLVGLAVWLSVSATLLIVGRVNERRAVAARRAVIDNETELTRLGLGQDGIGRMPARLLRQRHTDKAVGELVDEYLSTWQLTRNQEDLANQLLSEGFSGTLAELHAAARTLA